MWNSARSIVASAVALVAVGINVASAADVTILSGGAAKSALAEVIPGFEAATGHRVMVTYQPVGKLMAMLAEGATPDIVVLTRDVLDDARAKGHMDGSVTIGSVGIGVAVKAGAPVPDVSTPEAFKATLLAAKSIIMINPATGTSGRHLAQVFKDLGIADALAPKLKTLDAGFVAEKVAAGEVEIALHQMTELLPVAGITIVGPLPDALQKETVYVAGVGAKAAQSEAAYAFLAALLRPEAAAAIARKGYQ